MKIKIFRKNKFPLNGEWSTANGKRFYFRLPFSVYRCGAKSLLTLIVFTLLACGLWAQNGVTVSNLVVNAGTVTFNVSWNKNAMPVSVWLDSAWVFVDYNQAGMMKRLPLAPGATLTATSAPGTSRVVQYDNNNKGVWVIGNARAAGSFSATVQLLTTVNDVAGACVYASNYPPVGEYISDTEISFTGTPPYDLVLEYTNGSTITMQSGSTYPGLAGYTLKSFSDKTGAPGIMSCTALGSTVNFTAFSPCVTAPTGATWTLQDTRESNNNQNYKVKKMADGHIWMVQDLKFGDKCTNKTSFTGSNGKDLTGNVTSLTDKTYYGDCANAKNSSTPSNRGYLYDWAAAINKSGAYYGSSSNVGCSGTLSGTSGTNPGACQGICPADWHIPTSAEFCAVYNAMTSINKCSAGACWTSTDLWEGVMGGYMNGNTLTLAGERGYGQSSTMYDANLLRLQHFDTRAFCDLAESGFTKKNGYQVRCLKNY